MNKEEFMIYIAYENWKAYQRGVNQPFDEEIGNDQFCAMRNGVKFFLKNSYIIPEQSHANWIEKKISQGWIFGKVKDPKKRTHPDLVPYSDLNETEKKKNKIFIESCRFSSRLWDTIHNENEKKGKDKTDKSAKLLIPQYPPNVTHMIEHARSFEKKMLQRSFIKHIVKRTDIKSIEYLSSGKFTFACIEYKNLKFYGYSICSDKDKYNMKIGISRAYKRAFIELENYIKKRLGV